MADSSADDTATNEHALSPRRRSFFGRYDRRTQDAPRPATLATAVSLSKGLVAIVGALTILTAAAGALGFHTSSPGKSLDAVSVRVDSNVARITRMERRVDTLATQQTFTNYLLCVQMRTTNPALLPPDCAPIFQARGSR